jgi:hypothetical protein
MREKNIHWVERKGAWAHGVAGGAVEGSPACDDHVWHRLMEFGPPLMGCVVSNRNYSFEILHQTKECLINIQVALPNSR